MAKEVSGIPHNLRDESRRSNSLLASPTTSLRIKSVSKFRHRCAPACRGYPVPGLFIAAVLGTILSVGCAARSGRVHGVFQIKSVDSHLFIVPPTYSNPEKRAVIAIRHVPVTDRRRQSTPGGCTLNGRLFSLSSPHGTRGSWIFTFPYILDWTDDDDLKLQWQQFIRSLEDLFVKGCFEAVPEYLGLKSIAEDSFAFPLGDAMYFKYLYQEDGFVDLMPNMSVQVMRTRTSENSPLAISSTEVARYEVRLASNGRSLHLQRLDDRSKSSYDFYAFKQDKET